MTVKRVLGVFPHPDDEGTLGGALLKYGQSGIETGLICITRGEVGEISDPALATPETLGEVREGEMRAAAQGVGRRTSVVPGLSRFRHGRHSRESRSAFTLSG